LSFLWLVPWLSLLPFEFNYVTPDEMLHYVTGNHKDLVVIGIDQVSAVKLALA
jgi:hypothetical protein